MISALCSLILFQAPSLRPIWSIRLQTEIQSFAVGEQTIYFGTNDSYGSIDQSSGKKVWARSLRSPQFAAHVASTDDLMFVSIGQGDLKAFQGLSGKPLWSIPRTGYSCPIGAFNQAVYAALKPGTLSAIGSTAGKILWTVDLQKSEPSTKPVRFGKNIFVGTKSGAVFALDKDTGALVWRFKERPAAVQALTIGEDRIHTYYDDGSILALSLTTGQKMWAVYTNNGLFGTPLFRDGRIFVTSVGGSFYSLAALDGSQLWKKPLSFLQNFGLSQAMAFQGGFLIADRSKLVFLDGDGAKQWEVETGEDLFGQQPRPLGDDILLTGSHNFRRVRLALAP